MSDREAGVKILDERDERDVESMRRVDRWQEIEIRAREVARLCLTNYSDETIQCLGCSAYMREGPGGLTHDEDCPVVALRRVLGLDEVDGRRDVDAVTDLGREGLDERDDDRDETEVS